MKYRVTLFLTAVALNFLGWAVIFGSVFCGCWYWPLKDTNSTEAVTLHGLLVAISLWAVLSED